MRHSLIAVAFLWASFVQGQEQDTLIPVFKSAMNCNGVTIAASGRVFVNFPHLEGDTGMHIGELHPNGVVTPYPDLVWNNWKRGDPAGHRFVRTNSLRIGPDGNLWIVDTGTPRIGDPMVGEGTKLVVIDPVSDKVVRVIPLGAYIKPNSYVDDLRISGSIIYLTDAGAPALIVIDQATGRGRRMLEDQPSTTDRIPMLAEGKAMKLPDGQEIFIHADQLEISPDGKTLYFQPASGPLYRIPTRFLKDTTLSDRQRAKHVREWFHTPTTGGTAIDAAGNLYVTDAGNPGIIKIYPNGKSETIIRDARLIWADALWIDGEGFLWIPAAQLNRLAIFQQGVSKVQSPIFIYKMQIHAKPFRS